METVNERPKRNVTYRKLRALMAANGDLQKDLADMLGICQQAVSFRFSGRSDWRLTEMYAIMDRYNMPYNQLHLVFPPWAKGA